MPVGQLAAGDILLDPLRNRGVAFTPEQRAAFGLVGRLPPGVLSLDDQARRAWDRLLAQPGDLAKNVMMKAMHDRNEVLYYRVLADHLKELLPVVYDPTIGEAVKRYSHEYRRPRGVYLSIDAPEEIGPALGALGFGADDVDLVVVTDAEQILGIGDWGTGGMAISVGKLAVYTAAAGIDPGRTIPVMLDVGTDNEVLLNDPMYLGNRHGRVRGERYDAMIEAYLETASELFPQALLHFEDFGRANARRILQSHREHYRIFNDDMQGTGAIVLAGVLAGLRVTKQAMRDQRVVIFGAGTAGVGIADQLREAMVRDGLDRQAATLRIWCVDKQGLLTDALPDLPSYQQPYARPAAEAQGWGSNGRIELQSAIEHVKPTILVGTSTAHGAFTEPVIRAMAAGCERPIIFPISNPTERIEALPVDVVPWSDGRALVSTGIPLDPVVYDGVAHKVGQANNALVYPGLGLGTIVARAAHVSDGMLKAAAEALTEMVDTSGPAPAIIPDVQNLRACSATVAVAVALQAQAEGLAEADLSDPVEAVRQAMWQPVYPPLEVA